MLVLSFKLSRQLNILFGQVNYIYIWFIQHNILLRQLDILFTQDKCVVLMTEYLVCTRLSTCSDDLVSCSDNNNLF